MSEVESIKKIVDAYPFYLLIYKKYIKGEKVYKELDELYRPLFSQVLVPYYMDILPNIKEIMDLIEKTHVDPENPCAILDYLEFLCGAIYYETFVYELDKIEVSSIRLEHLMVFKYILYVEYVKYSQYNKLLSSIDPNSQFKATMLKRKDITIKKINFTIDLVERKYSESNKDFVTECKQIITNDFNLELSNEYFNSKINYLNLCK